MADPNYLDWSKDRLLERVKELEAQLERERAGAEQGKAATPLPPPPPTAVPAPVPQQQSEQKKKKKKNSKIDPSRYSTRFVALKLAYLGKRYGGFEYQPGVSPPSIEEELWKALVKSCLIWPERPDKVDFGPWEYSKCGRTDRGVSAFGQVIGIRLRSNRPVAGRPTKRVKTDEDAQMAEAYDSGKPAWDPLTDEINYPRVLNRLLPPDIRVLAWAPTLPPNFSARFSCGERQYRYFFTQPAFAPPPASLVPSGARGREGWLDIKAMRAAAKMFEGLHDFRNLCKIDGSKQISNFRRRIFEADIVEVPDSGFALPYLSQPDFRPADVESADRATSCPKVYYFHVRGSAFLWHQIRHMVAILFSVGQGLEKPSLVADLLDVSKQPRKPNYNMADEVPLVLWDCIFPKADEAATGDRSLHVHGPDAAADRNMQDGIDWVWLGEDRPSYLHGAMGLVDQLWEGWRERKMDEVLANQLLDSVARKADLRKRLAESGPASRPGSRSQRVFEGGNAARGAGKYVPVLQRQLLATPEEVNDKWAQSKGFDSAGEMAKAKDWRSVAKANKNDSNAVDTSGLVDE